MQTLLVAACLALQAAAQSGDVVRIDWSRVTDRNTDLAAVRDEYVAAINARDAGSASDLYAPDALALYGDADVLRGSSALAGRLRDGSAPAARTITLMPHKFSVSTDVGSETGTFVVTAADPNTQPVEGAYVAVYSRGADGRWRIAMEVRTAGAADGVW